MRNYDSDNLYLDINYDTSTDNTVNADIIEFVSGTITINDDVNEFGFAPKISGSKNQEILDKFWAVSKKFQAQRLEFIKKDFDAKKANDKELIEKLQDDYKKLTKKRVLYTSNFIISNANSEAASYIALTELYDASLKILDTVNTRFTPEVKNSIYGKRYQEYLDKIKASEEK